MGELGRIHVAEVHDEALIEPGGNELRHLSRKSEHRSDRAVFQPPIDKGAQPLAVEERKRQRATADQRVKPGGGSAAAADLDMSEAERSTQCFAQGRKLGLILFVVGEAGQVHPGSCRQILDQIP